jgi:hypothetical protein
MFTKTITDSATGAKTQNLNYWSIGIAVGLLLVILGATFYANNIGFKDAVTPLLTTFTTGTAGVFGATVGESAAKST